MVYCLFSVVLVKVFPFFIYLQVMHTDHRSILHCESYYIGSNDMNRGGGVEGVSSPRFVGGKYKNDKFVVAIPYYMFTVCIGSKHVQNKAALLISHVSEGQCQACSLVL